MVSNTGATLPMGPVLVFHRPNVSEANQMPGARRGANGGRYPATPGHV
jgi:hypothetical protein